MKRRQQLTTLFILKQIHRPEPDLVTLEILGVFRVNRPGPAVFVRLYDLPGFMTHVSLNRLQTVRISRGRHNRPDTTSILHQPHCSGLPATRREPSSDAGAIWREVFVPDA